MSRLLLRIGEADAIDRENIIGDVVGLYVKPVIVAVRLLEVMKELLALQVMMPFGIVNTIA